jgi:hypothetical protein
MTSESNVRTAVGVLAVGDPTLVGTTSLDVSVLLVNNTLPLADLEWSFDGATWASGLLDFGEGNGPGTVCDGVPNTSLFIRETADPTNIVLLVMEIQDPDAVCPGGP